MTTIQEQLEYELALLLVTDTFKKKLSDEEATNIAQSIPSSLKKNASVEQIKEELTLMPNLYPPFDTLSKKYLEELSSQNTEEQIAKVREKLHNILHESLSRSRIPPTRKTASLPSKTRNPAS